MNRIYKGLLSSIIALMMVITTALIPGLFNLSSVSAAGHLEFTAETGVFDLQYLDGSTNDHTQPHVLWENDGRIYVAFAVHVQRVDNKDSTKISGFIEIAGVEATYVLAHDSTDRLIIRDESNNIIFDQLVTSKTGSDNYIWLVASIPKPANYGSSINLVADFTANGFDIDANYLIVGLIRVEHQYGAGTPIIDYDQSVGSALGGLTGTVHIYPDSMAGFEFNSVTVRFDSPESTPILVTTSGAGGSTNFTGGSITIDGNGHITLVFSAPFDREIFIDYHYTQTFVVLYNANGGTGVLVDANSPYDSGDLVTVLDPMDGTIARVGFTFTGWNTQANGSGMAYAIDATFNIVANVTLYAQWDINDYQVLYEANGGTGVLVDASSPYDFNELVTVLDPMDGTIARVGFTFTGWNTKADGSGMAYAIDATFNIDSDVTLFAQWGIVDYTFTFDPNWGTEINVVQTFNVGGSVNAAMFSREGFVFIGWTLDEDGLVVYDGGLTNLPAQNIYVYAQWEEVPEAEFVLTFVTNQPGLTIPSIIFAEGETIVAPVPVLEGFVFLGWYADADLLVEFDEFDSMPARDVTVYADWGEVAGDDDEDPLIPDMSDEARAVHLGLFFLIIGMLAVIASKKEEELV